MPRPDEGLIHAWLDGQLTPEEAARIEQLAATDAEWGAAVAEARGLVAASSRILSALDQVPAGVIPPRATAPLRRRMPWWTKAAAAIVLVAGGSALVLQRAPVPVAHPPRVEQALPEALPAAPATTAAPAAIAANVPRPTPMATAAPKAMNPDPKESPAPAPPPPAEAREASQGAARDVVRDAMREATTERAMPAPAAVRALAAAPPTADAAVPQARAMLEPTERAARRETSATSATSANSAKSALSAVRVGAVGLAPPAVSGGCYEVRAVQTPNTVVIMRAVRADGDTLRLQAVQGTSTHGASALRAWVIVHDGTGRGAMTSAADGSGAVAVVATVAPCPAP